MSSRQYLGSDLPEGAGSVIERALAAAEGLTVPEWRKRERQRAEQRLLEMLDGMRGQIANMQERGDKS